MKYPGFVYNRETFLRYQDRGIVLRDPVTGESQVLNDWLEVEVDERMVAVRDRNQIREFLREQADQLSVEDNEEKQGLIGFLENWIVPNVGYDEEATAASEERAAADVEQVAIQIKSGKTIVRAGDEITSENLAQLNALRDVLLQRVGRGRQAVGIFIVISFLITSLWFFVHVHESEREKSWPDFVLLSLVLTGSLLISRFFVILGDLNANSLRQFGLQDPVDFYLLAPYALGAILIFLLVGLELSLFFTVMFSVFVALMTREMSIFVFALSGCLAAIASLTLKHHRDRSAIIQAGVTAGFVNIVIALALQLVTSEGGFQWQSFLLRSLAGIVGGLSAPMLTSLFLPALERMFRLTTDVRLLELSNLNSPILRRLALEAPGTYHHSITVGTLAEAGAEAIGANSLLIRVGAYYHDIGKLRHPEYYVENQLFSVNKHESLAPTMSSLILASHVKDGLAIAKEAGLGPRVSALIPQHHGTRLMTYFYQKAKDAAADKNIELSENDFRYPGPKPQSREAAILMLADQVEAAARTLQDPSPGQMRGLIDRLTQATIRDGQFDECHITMMELNQVARAFERVLTGMYHHRIEYPGFEFNKQGDGRRTSEQPRRKQPDGQRVQ
jgi:putative nucleotidyltransferase with HDIG domain